MTLGNMREMGVQRLVASCLNDACRHVALINVSGYPATPSRRRVRIHRGRAIGPRHCNRPWKALDQAASFLAAPRFDFAS